MKQTAIIFILVVVLSVVSIAYAAMRTSSATGAAGIALTIAPGYAWNLREIRVHLSAAGDDESFTATMDAGLGANYDTLLYSVNMSGVTSLVKTFSPPIEMSKTDEVDIAYTNTSTRTYGIEVKYNASH